MDVKKTYEEKAWHKLHKNATSNIEQVMEAAPNKATAVLPSTTHHHKLSKLDELDMWATAGEVGTS